MLASVSDVPPLCAKLPLTVHTGDWYPAFGVAVKVMLLPPLTVCAVLGLIVPLTVDGVTVKYCTLNVTDT